MNSLPQRGRLGKRPQITVSRSGDLGYVAAVLLAVLSPVCASDARADPVAAHEAVTIRLVADPVGPDGEIRGAVVLDLAPGWKTYWIDPGEAGLAPAITVTAGDGAAAMIDFPAPRRFEEAGIVSTGYLDPVGIGFVADAGTSDRLEATVAIGVCRTVCIPVTAKLATPVRAGGRADALVAWTFAALPDASADRFRALLSPDRSALLVEMVGNPPGAGADLFAAGPEGWSFGPARRLDDGRFSLPVLARREDGEAPVLRVVLADGESTVQALRVPVDTADRRGRL